MTTASTKTSVGDKLFVVEWNLSVNNSEEVGDTFECADCELLSIQSLMRETAGSGALPKMYFSNFDDAPDRNAWKISLKTANENFILIPPDVDIPARTRVIFPRLEGPTATATLRVTALFQEV